MWTLALDKQREWPAGTFVTSIDFRDPTLRDMRALPEIETARYLKDGSASYGIDWDAVDSWLRRLLKDEIKLGLIDQLSPAEAERAKVTLLGFFGTAEVEKPRSAPPTTSASEPSSAQTRID
ncbi:hypothetical protein [Bosea massiliensis]|uniref:Uncharacterized protein n=1 Tax=Bosea massiliensis TaxID=151419 RepID=A0ABW0NYF7_9HYPH